LTRPSSRLSSVCLIALAAFCLGGKLTAQNISSSTSSSSTDYAALAMLPSAPQPQTTQSAPTTTSQSQHDRAAEQLRRQEHQHILGVIPNFNTTDIQDAVPLSVKQKFDLMGHSVVNPFEFFAAGALAGYGQATDSHSGYGQGAAGYGKRYGASYADSADGALWGNAILPSLLHQDPRYFRRGHGPFWGRLKYSVVTTVWTKNDNGTHGLNYSNLVGNIISGGISNLYYPSQDRGVGLTFEGAAVVTAEGALGSLAVEFWPDVSHKLFHTPDRNPPAPAPK
jgi:hypothetical protein